jgi:ATP-dependent 26S proteasome regulatory subunit
MLICVVNEMQSRFDILKIHSRRMNLMRGIDLKKIAEKMNGASGAELKVCFMLDDCIFYVSWD